MIDTSDTEFPMTPFLPHSEWIGHAAPSVTRHTRHPLRKRIGSGTKEDASSVARKVGKI